MVCPTRAKGGIGPGPRQPGALFLTLATPWQVYKQGNVATKNNWRELQGVLEKLQEKEKREPRSAGRKRRPSGGATSSAGGSSGNTSRARAGSGLAASLDQEMDDGGLMVSQTCHDMS